MGDEQRVPPQFHMDAPCFGAAGSMSWLGFYGFQGFDLPGGGAGAPRTRGTSVATPGGVQHPLCTAQSLAGQLVPMSFSPFCLPGPALPLVPSSFPLPLREAIWKDKSEKLR